ncbi:CLUMA_CG018793, isoform B [Clunio marinus]|uniref:Sugar transporter SWEET1 n=1 Tax=Clunio marinus TaxID=568069 RepID=A0A1J1IZY2_9DIPT|nr:CLUMA_CG018793, isoform B [Clunio marinus]
MIAFNENSFSFFNVMSRTALSVRFSQLLNDEAMLKTNIVGFSITVIYVSIFFHFVSPDEKFNHLMKILVAAAFIGLMIIYSKVEDPEKVQTRFGFVLTAFIYSLMVMPVIEVKKALYEKCTRHMPFPMIVSGTLVGSCWFLHGIIINNGIVILQNSTMLGLNLVQLSMFVIYPSQPASDTKKEKRKKKAE